MTSFREETGEAAKMSQAEKPSLAQRLGQYLREVTHQEPYEDLSFTLAPSATVFNLSKSNRHVMSFYHQSSPLACHTAQSAQSSQFRKFCIQAVLWKPFDWFFLVVIIANCITLALEAPTPAFPSSALGRSLALANYVFIGLFTAEAALKILALGFVLAPNTYLRNGWNCLDFLVVCVSFLDFTSLGNLTAVRSVRALRPLRTITKIPQLQVLVETLVRSIPMIADVGLLALFYLVRPTPCLAPEPARHARDPPPTHPTACLALLLAPDHQGVRAIFGVTTVQLYAGRLDGRCGLPDFSAAVTDATGLVTPGLAAATLRVQGVRYVVDSSSTADVCAGPAALQTSWFNSSEGQLSVQAPGTPSGAACPPASSEAPWGYFCTPWGSPGGGGMRNFDTILAAWLAIFQYITVTDWVFIMYDCQDALSWWVWPLHFAMVILGALFLVNLALAVLYLFFSKDKEFQEEEQRKVEALKLRAGAGLQRRHTARLQPQAEVSGEEGTPMTPSRPGLQRRRVAARSRHRVAEGGTQQQGGEGGDQEPGAAAMSEVFGVGQAGAAAVEAARQGVGLGPGAHGPLHEASAAPCLAGQACAATGGAAPQSSADSVLGSPLFMAAVRAGQVQFGRGGGSLAQPPLDSPLQAPTLAQQQPGPPQQQQQGKGPVTESVMDPDLAPGRLMASGPSPEGKPGAAPPDLPQLVHDVSCRPAALAHAATSTISAFSLLLNTGASNAADSPLPRLPWAAKQAGSQAAPPLGLEPPHPSDPAPAAAPPVSVWGPPGPGSSRWRLAARWLALSPRVEALTTAVIVLNAAAMALIWYGMSAAVAQATSIVNYTFTVYFVAELASKLCGLGIRAYMQEGMNVFDAFVTVAGAVEMAVELSPAAGALGSYLLVLRAFRLLRVLLSSVSAVSWLTALLLLFMFIWSLLGMQFFGYELARCDAVEGSLQLCPPGLSLLHDCPPTLDCYLACSARAAGTWFDAPGSPYGGQAYCERFPRTPHPAAPPDGQAADGPPPQTQYWAQVSLCSASSSAG
ncbi:hypothetical protein QJQ45_022837 [Haematococcus lacustris]|nr:hypothetical protein QJQ45_022837 [Haematococcus lacustris]